MKKIILGGDHAAPELKNQVRDHLIARGFDVLDVGVHTTDSCNYPDIAHALCEKIQKGERELGFLICGTGIGIGIAASKVKGIRVGTCSDVYSAELSKRHNNSQILTMGARVVGIDLAKMIATHWLTAEFEGGRHQRRVDMITAIENGEAF